MSRIHRALISVSDATGLEDLARALHALDIEIIASSGTGAKIEAAGIPWLAVDEVTGAPEMLGGRVKTLHPGIHGGILARRDVPEDLERIAEFGIREIGLVERTARIHRHTGGKLHRERPAHQKGLDASITITNEDESRRRTGNRRNPLLRSGCEQEARSRTTDMTSRLPRR